MLNLIVGEIELICKEMNLNRTKLRIDAELICLN